MPGITLREVTTPSELETAFEILRELRTNLTFSEFRKIYERAKAADSYRLVGCFEGEACLAVMGYRVLSDFVHGVHLYVDDLVTTAARRSEGLGKRLLQYAEAEAQREN